jgi:hypothetical protein
LKDVERLTLEAQQKSLSLYEPISIPRRGSIKAGVNIHSPYSLPPHQQPTRRDSAQPDQAITGGGFSDLSTCSQLRAGSGTLVVPSRLPERISGPGRVTTKPRVSGGFGAVSLALRGSGSQTPHRRARIHSVIRGSKRPDDVDQTCTSRPEAAQKIMLCAPTRMIERLPASTSRSAPQELLSTTRPARSFSTPNLSSFPRYRCS